MTNMKTESASEVVRPERRRRWSLQGKPVRLDADYCRSTCSKPCNAREQSAVGATSQLTVTDEAALEAACAFAAEDSITGEPSAIAMKAGTALACG